MRLQGEGRGWRADVNVVLVVYAGVVVLLVLSSLPAKGWYLGALRSVVFPRGRLVVVAKQDCVGPPFRFSFVTAGVDHPHGAPVDSTDRESFGYCQDHSLREVKWGTDPLSV